MTISFWLILKDKPFFFALDFAELNNILLGFFILDAAWYSFMHFLHRDPVVHPDWICVYKTH